MEIKVGTKEWYASLRNKSLSSGFGKISDEAISLVIYEYHKSTKKNLSDLEIVQKALGGYVEDGLYLHLDSEGWVIYQGLANPVGDGRSICDLLTWAKQTVTDRCPSHESEGE